MTIKIKIKNKFKSSHTLSHVWRNYNLQGMPVAHPEAAPGIYIHNGRKVVVK